MLWPVCEKANTHVILCNIQILSRRSGKVAPNSMPFQVSQHNKIESSPQIGLRDRWRVKLSLQWSTGLATDGPTSEIHIGPKFCKSS